MSLHFHFAPLSGHVSLFIDYKSGSFNAIVLFTKVYLELPYPVFLSHFVFRVAQQQERQIVFFYELVMPVHRIGADTQNNGIVVFKTLKTLLEIKGFRRSARG